MELVKCSIIITSRFFQSYFEEVRTSRSLAERCGFQLPSRVCHQRDRTFPSPVGIVLTPSSFACHSKAQFITLIDATASLCQSPPPPPDRHPDNEPTDENAITNIGVPSPQRATRSSDPAAGTCLPQWSPLQTACVIIPDPLEGALSRPLSLYIPCPLLPES